MGRGAYSEANQPLRGSSQPDGVGGTLWLRSSRYCPELEVRIICGILSGELQTLGEDIQSSVLQQNNCLRVHDAAIADHRHRFIDRQFQNLDVLAFVS